MPPSKIAPREQLSRWQFSGGQVSSSAFILEGNCTGSKNWGAAIIPGSIILGGNCSGGQLSVGQFSSWTIVRTPHDRCKIFHYTFQFSTLLFYTLLSKLELFVMNRNFYRLRGLLSERQSGQCFYRNKCPKLYFPVFPRLKHVVNQLVYLDVKMDD